MRSADKNLFSVFAEHFPDDLGSTLLTTESGEAYSYADAIDESGRIARCLSDIGLRAGDRVTVQAHKSPMFVWLYLGCLRGGFVLHPLNTDYQLDELAYFISNAKPSVIVCDPEKQQIFGELTRAVDCDIFTLDANGDGSLSAATAEMPSAFRTRERKDTDLAVLLYSSGTTGVPKGAKLSHGNLSSNALTLVSSWGFTQNDNLLHALPVYHAHGLLVALGCVLMSGSSMTFLQRFEAGAVLAALPECTVMMGVPTFYTRLLAHPELTQPTCSHMRLFISGSAPLLAESFNAFTERTGHRILERYGMTETLMNASNPLDGERRPGSVGPALPGITLRVVDDNDTALPADEIGHLQVQGPNVFSSYWEMRSASAKEFTADGYFRTGDLAAIAADGYITIAGRSKDMIISGGLNIYPRELEQAIDALPTVAESAVIGVPHADFGEAVVAVVVPSGPDDVSTAEITGALRTQLAAFKLPKAVISVSELPRNSMGKVQKTKLREAHAHALVAASQN